MVGFNGVIEDLEFVGWGGVGTTDWEAPAGLFLLFALMVREQKTLQNRRNYWAAIQRKEWPLYRRLLF